MYDKHYVGLDLTGFQDNGIQRPVSRVTLKLDDNNVLTAGDDTGLEIISDCPHATQEMVNALLAQLKGTQYQMFNADDARIDPAAELGDGITAGGVYSVISRIADDGSGFPGVTAPGEAELEDEYPAGGPMTQEFNRKIAQTNSRITKTAEQIRLEVENEVKGLNAAITIELNKITQEVNDVNAGLSSKIEQTASDLTARITNTAAGLENEIKATADSLTAKISATDGRVTSISATVDGIGTRVTNAENGISTLTQTATSLQSQISAANGNISTLTQTVNGVSVSIGNAEGRITTVEATINGLTVKDTSGTTFISGSKIATNSITASQIDVSTLKLKTLYTTSGGLDYVAITSETGAVSKIFVGGNGTYNFRYIDVYASEEISFGRGYTDFQNALCFDTKNRIIKPKNGYSSWSIGGQSNSFDAVYSNEVFVGVSTSGIKIASHTIKPHSPTAATYYCGTSDSPFDYGYFKNINASSKIGFFGTAPASKQTVATMTATTSTTATDVARKLNDLISALKKYGLV